MRLFICLCLLGLSVSVAQAQPKGPKFGGPRTANNPDLKTYLLSFDTSKDGALTKKELTDKRLYRLFDRADTDKNGTVSAEELTALLDQIDADTKKNAAKGGFGGPGGFGRPGGFGGGRPPFERPGQSVQLMPVLMRAKIKLSADQRKQLQKLQQQVDAQLKGILTPEQQRQLQQSPQAGFGGRVQGDRPDGPPKGGFDGPRKQ